VWIPYVIHAVNVVKPKQLGQRPFDLIFFDAPSSTSDYWRLTSAQNAMAGDDDLRAPVALTLVAKEVKNIRRSLLLIPLSIAAVDSFK